VLGQAYAHLLQDFGHVQPEETERPERDA
jgi:hypothetical protein